MGRVQKEHTAYCEKWTFLANLNWIVWNVINITGRSRSVLGRMAHMFLTLSLWNCVYILADVYMFRHIEYWDVGPDDTDEGLQYA